MNNRNSIITKEQLTEWVSQLDSDGDCDATDHQLAALIRQSLVAMDSKPVIADCDPEVFGKGVSVCLISIPKETAEVICQNISAATGCKVDWHYFGGRVHIKALPPSPQTAPDEMLCDFYGVKNWPDLVRELVEHVEQLQDSAKRNVKPWEDTFPETLLPAYIERVKQADEACRMTTDITELTQSDINTAMLSSTEGFSFLVIDSLEFEMGRELTEKESQRVYQQVDAAINNATSEAVQND